MMTPDSDITAEFARRDGAEHRHDSADHWKRAFQEMHDALHLARSENEELMKWCRELASLAMHDGSRRDRLLVMAGLSKFGPPRTQAGSGACCEFATQVKCVCAASYTCPIHGDRCHGSHD